VANPYLTPTLPEVLPDDPMVWAEAWLQYALDESVQRNPNSVNLATVDADGNPSARVVLCKKFVAEPGFFVFHTNRRSRKSADIATDNRVAATFHWDALGRQMRFEGVAVDSPDAESDDYFQSRDWGSQVGAWGSDQSALLDTPAALRQQIRQRARELGVDLSADLQTISGEQQPVIPRPPHWGGTRIWPTRMELWVEGADRVHDRAAWTRTLEPADASSFLPSAWSGTRLQP
jgi:pyridoxamine 5'-phosphate oxidase